MIQEHLVAKLIQQSQQTADELVSLYDKAPLEEPKASSSSKQAADPLTDAFDAFYEGVAQIDDWFRDYPDDAAQDLQIPLPDEEDFEEGITLLPSQQGQRAENAFAEVLARFSGEEGLGRYLDLNALYERYLNLKGIKRPERGYLEWLETFDDTENIPKASKNNDYQQYIFDFFRECTMMLTLLKISGSARQLSYFLY